MMASIRVCTIHEYVRLAVATSDNHSDSIIINSDHSCDPLHVQWNYTLCFTTFIITFTLASLVLSQCHIIQAKNYHNAALSETIDLCILKGPGGGV